MASLKLKCNTRFSTARVAVSRLYIPVYTYIYAYIRICSYVQEFKNFIIDLLSLISVYWISYILK